MHILLKWLWFKFQTWFASGREEEGDLHQNSRHPEISKGESFRWVCHLPFPFFALAFVPHPILAFLLTAHPFTGSAALSREGLQHSSKPRVENACQRGFLFP